MMGSKLIAIGLLCLTLTGCINLYTRCPGTDSQIVDTYQSTRLSIATAYVVAFPQIITGWQPSIELENFITIPFGLLVLCDTACEAVVDTICLPYDCPVSNYRNGNNKRDGGDDL